MGMKKSALVTSIATIGLCASMIVGSTWALFETKKTTDIVVSSGSVNVTAGLGTTVAGQHTMAYGSCTIDSTNGKVGISNMVPGDKVVFTMAVEDVGNISTQCKILIKEKVDPQSPAAEGAKLVDALNVSVSYVPVGENTPRTVSGIGNATGYFDPKTIKDNEVTVTISFKENLADYNQYQGKAANLQVIVEAVQANGAT